MSNNVLKNFLGDSLKQEWHIIMPSCVILPGCKGWSCSSFFGPWGWWWLHHRDGNAKLKEACLKTSWNHPATIGLPILKFLLLEREKEISICFPLLFVANPILMNIETAKQVIQSFAGWLIISGPQTGLFIYGFWKRTVNLLC